jgi:hypothetical protein
MYRIRVILAAVAVPVTVAALVLTAQGAQASTPECLNGTYTGFCATQIDNGSPVLVMDNSGQREAANNPVIGWTNSSTDPATDWFQLAFAGDNSLGVMFFWAPTGVNLDLCVADPGDGHVVLRVCNGSNWQRWIAAPVAGSTGFFTWTNRATHRILQSGAKGAQLVTVAQTSMISGNQQWKFGG